MKDKWKTSTSCVHFGENRKEPYYSITTPIVNSAPFRFSSSKELLEFVTGKSSRVQPEYGRMGNPTISSVQEKLAKLEDGEKGLLFASGMCAFTTTLLVLLKKGDHIIITDDSYRRTRDFVVNFLPKFGIESTVTQSSLTNIKKEIKKNTKIIFSESPTNPYLHVLDLEGISDIGKKKKIITIIDNTIATPVNQKPLEYGIDLVIHAATKYLGGHNDLIAGVLIGSDELVQPITEMLMTIGGICDPTTAYLLERGLKTLDLRVKKHNENGLKIAQFIEKHPKVLKVFYPGLKSHPEYKLAKKQMKGFGGLLSFLLKSDFKGTMKFIDSLKIPQIAPSFGGPESLIEQPALMSFMDITKEERKKLGIFDNLIRFSLGIEDSEDIIEDLKRGLDAV